MGFRERFAAALAGELQAWVAAAAQGSAARAGRAPGHLVVSVVGNGREDWSFGYGRAQFETGEL